MSPVWISDHPRSRGVYASISRGRRGKYGSSPLARGLHAHGAVRNRLDRIIPARAGFTCRNWVRSMVMMDHPRSRGVYRAVAECAVCTDGSSPLARGLRPGQSVRASVARIIPARAGFTPAAGECNLFRPDHPRSRGVYLRGIILRRRRRGSSPLARGLRFCARFGASERGIIPARAGFTAGRIGSIFEGADHPRSRGVYDS